MASVKIRSIDVSEHSSKPDHNIMEHNTTVHT